jgi:hypothetical protein
MYQKALAYTQCMRTHGEVNWPDPTTQGTFNDSQIDISSPQYISATQACQSLRVADGIHLPGLSPAQQQQAIDRVLKLAMCMRAHGIPGFPDPACRTCTTRA